MHNIRLTVAKIKTFREGILSKYLDKPLFQKSLRDVRKVAIINSSSRSGSSLLYTLLGKLPGVYSLSGEAAPFYKLNTALNTGPGGFDLFESDKIPASLIDSVIDYEGMSRDFFSDLYCADGDLQTKDIDPGEYTDHLMLRLSLQWTDLDFEQDRLRHCIDSAFEKYAAQHQVFVVEDFYLDMLEKVEEVYPGVNPFYYDISTEKVSLRFPFTEIPSGPPNEWFNIEEPPFILQPARAKAGPSDLSEKTLLLKSTVDCYRMNLIEKIFPEADIRIMHLVRNPAATANGIYDGWLHRGFFSHNLRPYLESHDGPAELSIRGYSDLHPFGRYWWNFDLPEGWQDFADKDLVEVCGFQWHSANSEILTYLGEGRKKVCRIHFEDVIRALDSRTAAFEEMLGFLGIPSDQIPLLRLGNLPVVQSTLPPQLYRWKKRKDIISRLLDDPVILDMSERLGYSTDSMDAWL